VILYVAAEPAQAETNAPLDRAETYAGALGDLLVGEPAEECQLDRRSELWGESDQCCPQSVRLYRGGDGPAVVLVGWNMSLATRGCRSWSPN
jgi:hypothetical protein